MHSKLVRRLAAICLAIGLILGACAAPGEPETTPAEDTAAPGEPEGAQTSDSSGAPTLHFRDPELAAEAVYTEDPLGGDFSDAELAAEAALCPTAPASCC